MGRLQPWLPSKLQCWTLTVRLLHRSLSEAIGKRETEKSVCTDSQLNSAIRMWLQYNYRWFIEMSVHQESNYYYLWWRSQSKICRCRRTRLDLPEDSCFMCALGCYCDEGRKCMEQLFLDSVIRTWWEYSTDSRCWASTKNPLPVMRVLT